jgi:hypothetical protein
LAGRLSEFEREGLVNKKAKEHELILRELAKWAIRWKGAKP